MDLATVIARVADYADDAFIIAEAEPQDEPGPRVVWCNAAFERMSGYSRAEIIGRNPRILQGPGTNPEARRRIRDALREWRPVRQEILNYRKDGTPFWVELSIHPVLDDAGWCHFWVAVQRNITERKHVELDLARHTHELEQANEELNRFAFVASHDLQEPLRKIASFAQLIEMDYKNELDENAVQYIHFMVDGVKRMQFLIQDLLTYSRTGMNELQVGAVDLGALVNDVAATFSDTLAEAGGAIDIGPLPTVRADRTLMWQLFQNLISNALKYRSDMPPTVTIRAQAADHDAIERAGSTQAWVVTVADNGIGFDQRHAKRIFQVFERLHRKEEYSGTGIGLAICDRIVRRHGGRIWAEGAPGVGATFSLVLPVSGPTPAEAALAEDAAQLAPPREA